MTPTLPVAIPVSRRLSPTNSRTRPSRLPPRRLAWRFTRGAPSGPGGTRALPQQEREPDRGHRHADQAHHLRDAEGAEHQRVHAEAFREETAEGVEAEIGQEQRAGRPLQPVAEHEVEQEEDDQVPHGLVEEGRVEELRLRVLQRPVRWRDEELPRQIGRTSERFLVEEVPPSPDGLPEREAGCRHVEELAEWQAPTPRVHPADEHAGDHPAVYREAAL